jgi:four helix bundle protein
MKSHKDLEVWKESMNLVVDIYEITKSFPQEERYGLTSQIRRSAVSIPSNISEGAARRNTKEFIQFLYISLGSLAELETQIEIAQRIRLIAKTDEQNSKIYLIRAMLSNLIKSLNKKIQS